jgi:hypothetical protein
MRWWRLPTAENIPPGDFTEEIGQGCQLHFLGSAHLIHLTFLRSNGNILRGRSELKEEGNRGAVSLLADPCNLDQVGNCFELGISRDQRSGMVDRAGQGKTIGIGKGVLGLEFGGLKNKRISDG